MTLRTLFLGGCSWLLLGASAPAADLPMQVKAPPAIATSWAGFYLGVHGGYGWGKNSFREYLSEADPHPFIDGPKSQGSVVGGHAGYNWQYGRAVTGLEIDWSAADISGSIQPFSAITIFGLETRDRSDHAKFLGTVRGRIGWLPSDRVLLYGTAGLAWGRFEERRASTVPAFNISTDVTTTFDRLGWVAGAGIEAMPFGPNWIGRIEYLHHDFGGTQSTAVVTSSLPGIWRADGAGRQTLDVLRAGLSYKFGAPGGVNAAYAAAPSSVAGASWAGFYLGAHGGYGWGQNDGATRVSAAPPTDIVFPKLRGGLYGGHVGYNWQFDRVVAGFEADLSIARIGGRAQVQYAVPPATLTEAREPEIEALGSLRARLGWAAGESLLLYGTAGLGWERIATTAGFSSVAPAGAVTSTTYDAVDRFGWVAGAGAEARLPGSNWIGRLEYLHFGFGTIAVNGVVTNAAGTFTDRASSHGVDVLRAGVSYKFGDQPPADPVRYAKAAAPTLPPGWGGFYLGGHVGYGWHDDDFTKVLNFTNGEQTGGIVSRGWLGGGHVGHNWQFGRMVAGMEADASFADIYGMSRPVSQPGFGGTEANVLGDRIKFLATARARLGWLPVDNLMLYATGGPAFARMERTISTTLTGFVGFRNDLQTIPSNRFGGVFGAGAEWMPFGPNWIGRIEYLHYDFGRARDILTQASTDPAVLPVSEHRGRQTLDVVRAGFSYKFP